MVFHCRCFSFLLQQQDLFQEEEDIEEYETRTQTKSTVTETFYTAPSDLDPSVLNLAEKASILRVFTLQELKEATKNFSRGSKIGEGGFGTVYKGVVKSLEHPFDEIQVAVKLAKGLLKSVAYNRWEGCVRLERVLGVVDHRNIVQLIGYFVKNDENGTLLLLVYEYMVNGSLRDHLSANSKTPLSWNMRLKVAQDVARGFTYLHEDVDFKVFSTYINSSHVLLDDQWNAKLSDYGLDLQGPARISTAVDETVKFIAPECFETRHLTNKSAVWSFGVFLYELITGRPPFDMPDNAHNLVEWVKSYVDSERFVEIVDSRLEGNYPLYSVQRLSVIADKCVSSDPKLRPKMSEVLEMVNQLIQDMKSKGKRGCTDGCGCRVPRPKLIKSCFRKK